MLPELLDARTKFFISWCIFYEVNIVGSHEHYLIGMLCNIISDFFKLCFSKVLLSIRSNPTVLNFSHGTFSTLPELNVQMDIPFSAVPAILNTKYRYYLNKISQHWSDLSFIQGDLLNRLEPLI
jgi:hypothetical protein